MHSKPGERAVNPIVKPHDLTLHQMQVAVDFFSNNPDSELVGIVRGSYVKISRASLKSYMSGVQALPQAAQQGPISVSPNIRGGKMAVSPELAQNKPECPDHFLKMVYDAENGYWTCPNFQCEKTARKKLTIGEISGTVIAGDMHLYADGDGPDASFYIYLRQLNAFLDVSAVLSRDTTGDVHGKTEAFLLSMEFPKLNRVDG